MPNYDKLRGRNPETGIEGSAIQGIVNPRIRNLVRGALSARTDAAFVKTMASLHRECTSADVEAAGRVLRSSVLARYSGRGEDFPELVASHADEPFYTATRIDLELSFQRQRLERETARLTDAIELVYQANNALLAGDRTSIEATFSNLASTAGASTMVALKAMSLRNSKLGRELGPIADSTVLEPYRRPRRAVVTSAFEDSSDDDRDYMRSRRFFVNLASNGRPNAVGAAMLYETLSPLHKDGENLASCMEAYGRSGLLDLVAFLFRAIAVLRRVGRNSEADAIAEAIPSSVSDVWHRAFKKVDTDALQNFVGRKDQFHDLALFSHLPAWSEFDELFLHRLDVEQAIGRRLDGVPADPSRDVMNPVLAKRSARDIAFEPVASAPECSWSARDGGFARTIALVASLEAGTLDTPSGEDLHIVLDRTINVPVLLTASEIENFLPPRKEDSLYEYLRAALLNDADGGAMRDHALRRAVELLLKDRFHGDVVEMMRSLDTEDGHVSKHLFQMFSETFLSSLYGTFRLADDVMEAQTRLLEWQAVRREDADARNRAKSLRLLIRLRRVRGSIEETRIYVDPLRLVEWVHENLEEDFRNLQPVADEILVGDDVRFNANDTLANSVQPRSRLLHAIDRSYSEFAANKIHGAASYIGRRVRHGKFYGHLAVEMKPTVELAIEEFRNICPNFTEFLRRWYRSLDTGTHDFAKERLHIRSKAQPKGLIIGTIEDPDKEAVLRIAIETIARALIDGIHISLVASHILDYCWLLMEVDLKRARAEIEGLRRKFIIEVESHLTGRAEVDALITRCVRDLNGELGSRFETAKSWLTKRANASPSASVSLMIEAVLDEVRERFEFDPVLVLPDDLDLDLIGHRFHFFYDTLWILVSNAAEYGLRAGGLRVTVSTSMEPDRRHVRLSVAVTSTFDPSDVERRRAEIDEVMSAEIGDAMGEEDGTGLRKVRSLVEEADEIVGFEKRYDGDTVQFVLEWRYPLS